MKGKKIINDPERLVPEIIEGLVLAAGGSLAPVPGVNALMRTDMPDEKVGLLIGGGSGHEPMYTAFVGDGLADASVCGNIFAAPTPDIILEATKAVNRGRGVLYVYGNYAGDNMNFDIAAELAAAEGIETRTVRVMDDVAVARHEDRRGIAGAFYQVKVAGAVCREAATLAEAAAAVERARAGLRSVGVAVRAGALPETGEPTFELGDDEIEIGMGAHGEPGVERRASLPSAEELGREMTRLVAEDLPYGSGDRVALLLNNLGASTMMELLIVNRTVRAALGEAGVEVARTDLGPYLTCQEMAGFSLTLMRLDAEIERWLAAPCASPAYSQAG
ncbi:MAG: dihydroxyacetone kinase subunit DhaK [Pseudomonadota bacterium]